MQMLKIMIHLWYECYKIVFEVGLSLVPYMESKKNFEAQYFEVNLSFKVLADRIDLNWAERVCVLA